MTSYMQGPVHADMGAREWVGGRVRARRESLGLVTREAAPRCGLSFSMLNQIETGSANTTVDRLGEIAEGMGMTLEELLAPTPPTPSPPPTASEAEAILASAGPRLEIVKRFAKIAPNVDDDEFSVFLYELALWEKRYGGKS